MNRFIEHEAKCDVKRFIIVQSLSNFDRFDHVITNPFDWKFIMIVCYNGSGNISTDFDFAGELRGVEKEEIFDILWRYY